jgi:hypothetical protein
MRSILLAFAIAAFTAPVAALAGSPSSSTCSDGGNRCIRSQLVIFEDSLFEGLIKTPGGSRFEVEERATFGRLLVLKKDLVLNIFATRQNRVLK